MAAQPDSWQWLETDAVESRCDDRLRKEAGMLSFGARRKCEGANTRCPSRQARSTCTCDVEIVIRADL